MRNAIVIMAGLTMWTCAGQVPLKVPRKFIHPAAFKTARPYSPGVLAGNTLYIAGQIDKDPATGVQPKGIAGQTRMAMNNVGHVLAAAGMDFNNVVTCHVQLADMADYKEMNDVYATFFGPTHYPARTTLAFPGLPGGARIEVSCIAYADKSKIALVTPPAGSVPPALGPYRSAVWAGDTLYVSGSGGRKPGGGELDPATEGQTKQALENIGQILAAAGLTHKDDVFANVYFLDSPAGKGQTYAALNSVYRNAFPLGTAPSRASFSVGKLPGTIGVEITVIATRDRKNKGRVVPDSAGPSPTSSNGGVLDGDTLYTSGKSGKGETVDAQMRDAMESIRNILSLAGMDMKNIVDAHVYLKDLAHMEPMNAVFQEYFPKNPPARTTVQVFQEQLIQVQVVAVR